MSSLPISTASPASLVSSFTRAKDVARPMEAPAVVHAVTQLSTILVERGSRAQLANLQPDWRDLLSRAAEPNVFMDPALALSVQDFAFGETVAILAWERAQPQNKLVGIWVFSVGRPDHSFLPGCTLRVPAMPNAYAATPVIDRSMEDAVLEAILQFIAAQRGLPKTLVLDPISQRCTTALRRVMSRRKGRYLLMGAARRPVLVPSLPAPAYLERAFSSSSRKKLRQHRRRLSEKGRLEYHIAATPLEVASSFEEFLVLEASGWKGKTGTALLCDKQEADFARRMMFCLAEKADASVHGLYLDGKLTSAQVVLRAGATAYTWKTAYDEALRDFSPGTLLLEDYTKAFIEDRSITLVDSCSFDETSFMSVWTERNEVNTLWLSAQSGGSISFTTVAYLQKAFFDLRIFAKGLLKWVKTWKL